MEFAAGPRTPSLPPETLKIYEFLARSGCTSAADEVETVAGSKKKRECKRLKHTASAPQKRRFRLFDCIIVLRYVPKVVSDMDNRVFGMILAYVTWKKWDGKGRTKPWCFFFIPRGPGFGVFAVSFIQGSLGSQRLAFAHRLAYKGLLLLHHFSVAHASVPGR